MAARPTWQGHLKLSLVTCPVALYTAMRSAREISFHLINPETNNRIRMVPTDPDTGPVERSDLVKGYEVTKDEYVLFDEADFDKVKLESTKTIQIDAFVDIADIDRLYWNDPFYVVPEKGAGVEAFAVIRDAMERQGKVALGSLVLRGRERQVALEARDKGIVLYTLRAHDEVRDASEYFDDIPKVKADRDMVDIAVRIIEQKQSAFDPSRFVDRYEDALREMIEAKKKGQGLVEAAEPDDTNVIDLMEALRASLRGGKSGPVNHDAPKTKTSRSAPKASAAPADRKPAAKRKRA